MQVLKNIRITRIETRPNDAWYDMSLRQLRNGQVNFYRAHDFLTGDWLFKTCRDIEFGKVMVKAVKCPAGLRFSQLEGNTMVFQQSQRAGLLYDIISLTKADENERLSRKVVDKVDEIPAVIQDNFETKAYEEATGKTAPGKHWVTLTEAKDEKAMITLFLLERAWTISTITPEERLETLQEQKDQKQKATRREIETGQTWSCPICGDKFQMKHIEKEATTAHTFKKA